MFGTLQGQCIASLVFVHIPGCDGCFLALMPSRTFREKADVDKLLFVTPSVEPGDSFVVLDPVTFVVMWLANRTGVKGAVMGRAIWVQNCASRATSKYAFCISSRVFEKGKVIWIPQFGKD